MAPTRSWLLRGLTVCLGILSTQTTEAGNGRFNAGVFDFCVSVRFNATAAELQMIRTAFQNACQVLADATDGHHRFGTLTIVNDSGAAQTAEFWVNARAGRAYATYGKYGVRGEHVNLFFDDNFKATSGANGDAYTIAHEHVHHAYGIADEYSGPGPAGTTVDAECPPGPDTAALSFCLMDNYFTRGGNAGGGGTYTLNELCVAANHDPDADTYQESFLGTSCWETIASHPTRSATAPAGLPTDAAPAVHTVTFRDGFGGLRVVLLIDRSGSMSIGQRIDFAKQGANTFIDFLADGDSVGVASFECSTSTNFPLTTISGSATKTSARAAINSLVASGATNIGGGLQTALSQLTSQTDRSCNEIIVLLSDGDHNCGTAPGAVIPALRDEGVTVFTVGVGTGLSTAGESTLQTIASSTGGKFYRVSSAPELVGLFSQLSLESTGSGLLVRAPETIGVNSSREFPILVEDGSTKVTFALTFADASDALVFFLRTPSGQEIHFADAATNPDVEFLSETNLRALRVSNPETGQWQMVVSSGAVSTGAIEVSVFSDNDGVQLNVSVENERIVFPEAAIVHATPTFRGQSVVGAAVSGFVLRPDGSRLPIELFDDGASEHADAVPADGIYSARFHAYSDDGTYVFDLRVLSDFGVAYGGETLFASVGAPSNEQPLPAFVRSATATAVVTGVPDFVVATVEYGPETINLKSRGLYVTAYIELPGPLAPQDVSLASVAVTAIDGTPVTPLLAKPKPFAIGDFDNDGIPDLMVKFGRKELNALLSPGMRSIEIQGQAGGQIFLGERSVAVIDPP